MSEHDILTFDYSAPYEDGQEEHRPLRDVPESELPHECGPWPYLYRGCPACDEIEERQ